ncbi:MAG: hypothetical protein Q7T96_02010 [Methylobacter sp.]|uniref:hypothetical protein n=1 Tax=Methylobacter sp. G7 TaxID=3230117 RepID=UPI002719F86B|nr:hypothetical protein [Methylobacter sp.]
MSKITEEMILACYEAFRAGNLNHEPKGMNGTSAKMTMRWLDSILNTRKSYNRSGSCMQYRVILERIRQDYDSQRAKEAALVLMEYCEQHNKQSHIMILERFINI